MGLATRYAGATSEMSWHLDTLTPRCRWCRADRYDERTRRCPRCGDPIDQGGITSATMRPGHPCVDDVVDQPGLDVRRAVVEFELTAWREPVVRAIVHGLMYTAARAAWLKHGRGAGALAAEGVYEEALRTGTRRFHLSPSTVEAMVELESEWVLMPETRRLR